MLSRMSAAAKNKDTAYNRAVKYLSVYVHKLKPVSMFGQIF